MAPGLVWCDDNIGGHEEGSILSWRNNIVCLVPDPVVEANHLRRQGHLEDILQRRLGVAFDLQDTNTVQYLHGVNNEQK